MGRQVVDLLDRFPDDIKLILQGISDGLSPKEMAHEQGMELVSLNNRITYWRKQFKAVNREHMIAILMRKGIIK